MIEAAEDHYRPLPFKGIFDEKIKEARAEAIKEFAERLKQDIVECEENPLKNRYPVLIPLYIDNLVKEMTEEKP